MQRCPICATEVAPSPRYPNYVCIACVREAAARDGRRVEFWDYPDFGGRYVGTEEYYNGEECFVRGVRCYAAIAYMGGTVIRPVPPLAADGVGATNWVRSLHDRMAAQAAAELARAQAAALAAGKKPCE